MDWTLRELEVFVAAAEAGSFTDAAIRLRVSQASVSRTVAALERSLGNRVLRRIPRGCEPTALGLQLLPHARRVLAEAARLSEFVSSQHGLLRLGYAWSALGRHTAPLQRRWAREHEDVRLELVRYNSATSGLAEGMCDAAIVRRPVDEGRFGSFVVGLERRLVAFAADDPQWARRRQVSMAEIADRTVVIDPRTGTTSSDLWQSAPTLPTFIESADVDSWLDAIAAGRGVGPLKDGPRIPVRLVWRRDARPPGLDDLVHTVTELYASA